MTASPRARAHGDRLGTAYLAVCLVGVALLLRAPITSMPAALPALSADLGLTPAVAGLATGLPLICFGAFAFLSAPLASRVGVEGALVLALGVALLGTLVRSLDRPVPFFVGVTLLGAGIAVGNVVVPALVRTYFAHRLAAMMGLYSLGLQLGAALGAAVTTPLMVRAGWSWQWALAAWAPPLALMLVLWAPVWLGVRRRGLSATRVPTSLAVLVRRPLVWATSLLMGLQALIFYSLLTWLPQLLLDAGLSAGLAGVLLTAFNLLGVPGSFLGPLVVGTRRSGPTMVALSLGYAVVFGLLLLGPAAAVAGAILGGLCQGAWLSISLTYIARQPNPLDVPGVSALSQGLGYLVAAVGPILLGALYSATGGWAIPLLVLLVALVGVVGCAVVLARADALARADH
ncbi:MAG: MFS transporter [Actinomycetales bacterium]